MLLDILGTLFQKFLPGDKMLPRLLLARPLGRATPGIKYTVPSFSYVDGLFSGEHGAEFRAQAFLEALEHGVATCEENVLQHVVAVGRICQSLCEDIRGNFYDASLVETCDCRLEDDFGNADAFVDACLDGDVASSVVLPTARPRVWGPAC